MNNILLKIKNNSFVIGIIGSVIGGVIFLCSIPIARFLWNLLVSWSNRFSLFFLNKILKLAVSGRMSIDYFIFILVFVTFIIVITNTFFTRWLPFRIKKKSAKKSTLYIFIIICFLYLFTFIFTLNTHNIVVELNARHKQRMGIIAPYINDEKEEELWSKWYSIESKIDYLNLNYELENIAESNNLKLPKLFY